MKMKMPNEREARAPAVIEKVFKSRRLDNLYQLLGNQEDALVSTATDYAACQVGAGDFLLQITTPFFTRLGDSAASPTTLLAWLLAALSAPAVFTAFLVPVRESGSLIPQLFIASYVRRQPVRKWIFVAGSVLQAVAVACMVVVALALTGTAAGIGLLSSLILFSLARGLCSVSSKDVLGKTVPKTRRGRVSGWSEFLAGFITIGVGVSLLLDTNHSGAGKTYLILLSVAAALWLLAAVSYGMIREFP